ncbi:CsbD family protein [Planctopirus hydrillae]|uniref:General stress protein CsbD n=1 Tax=Planctopirus hydrillae TaxID=1841610 RepID=A0A1C3EAS2_9PLAN|nr:CsbD family protein [Planctopirus hydrillae]ODA30357.1 general stress protein CsbD [Planctopirus hydrillae]
MITREEIQGQWTQLKGQIRERWGQISDDELQQAQGNTEQLIGLLEKKTGESRRQLEQFVQGAVKNGQNFLGNAGQTVREYAQTAAHAASQRLGSIESGIESGMQEAHKMVSSRPLESITTAFGVGLLAGVVVTLLLRSDRA